MPSLSSEPTDQLNDHALERALVLAARGHEGQRKRGREPFILHVIRVVAAVESPDAQVTAALHDLVEKTEWTLDGLRREGFAAPVVAAVDALTKRPDESWEAQIARAEADALAREVKIADLADNLTRTALEPDTPAKRRRLSRYRQALERLRTDRPVE